MVIRSLLLAALAAALAGCPSGKTCGRGRCQAGACINVVNDYATRDQASLDWWCAVPCSGERRCPGPMCLQSPNNSDLQVCAGDQMLVKYRYDGEQLTVGGGGTTTLNGYSLVGSHYAQPLDCKVGVDCDAGWYKAGEMLPAVIGSASGGLLVLYNGAPGYAHPAAASAGDGGNQAPLGPLLPTGLPVVIHLAGYIEPLQ